MKTATRFREATLAGAVSLACIGATVPANAAALGPASGYNVFVLGDVNQYNTDIEGKLAAGGNVTLNTFGVGHRLPANSGSVLVAGGHLNLANGEVQHGNAVYGGTANLGAGVNIRDGSLVQGNPIDFAAAGSYLQNLSTYLAGLTPNGTTTVHTWGGIDLNGNSANINLFNLLGSAVSTTNYFGINAPTGSTVVVNVSGQSVSLKNFGFNIQGVSRQKVLYNFFEATSLDASGISIEGSILAPFANFSFNNGQINGSIIAQSLRGNGESHNYGFDGDLPTPTPTPDPKSVPEPGAMAGLGLAATAFLASRRKQRPA